MIFFEVINKSCLKLSKTLLRRQTVPQKWEILAFVIKSIIVWLDRGLDSTAALNSVKGIGGHVKMASLSNSWGILFSECTKDPRLRLRLRLGRFGVQSG